MRPVTSLNAAAGKYAQSIGVARLDNDQSKRVGGFIPIAAPQLRSPCLSKKSATLF